MYSLAVFDFDRTIVHADSDQQIISFLRGHLPPSETESFDWTPYMNLIFERVFELGFTKEDILEAIGKMAPVPGIKELMTRLKQSGWRVILITDSNAVFVNHWLKCNDLQDMVDETITNPAQFDPDGRLRLFPCMEQSVCDQCPRNLCKSLALADYRARARCRFARVAYMGDGKNDLCPMRLLGRTDVVFPRIGFPCHKMISATPSLIRAKVIPWTDAYDVMKELCPDSIPRMESH